MINIYVSQNQCIYEMDTAKSFTIVPSYYDLIIC